VGLRLWLFAGLMALGSVQAWAQATSILVASTTSTEQSGLFAHLLPEFTRATGIGVKVVAVGSGQALDIGRRGDADVVFVHDPVAEDAFVAEGHARVRLPVMFNDFVVVGPRSDPAGARGKDLVSALKNMASSKVVFVSRGDRSGTHAAELRHWVSAGIAAPAGHVTGYISCGCGMGPALNMAASMNGYVLTDRGTWLAFRNRGELTVLVEGDARLVNQYAVMVVDAARHPHVKAKAARAFADWLVSPAGQAHIAAFRIHGEQLFFPNATRGR
jgi:tungstate transport system substrate-binding protein